MKTVCQSSRLTALVLSIALGLTQGPPAFALRQPNTVESSKKAGLEQALQPHSGLEEVVPFVSWEGAPDRVLVRPRNRPLQPIPEYPLDIARHLDGIMEPVFRRHLRNTYQLEGIPLVRLEEASARLRKPVYLFRDALLPTGSPKTRIFAVLIDQYLNDKDIPPEAIGVVSTGNQLLGAAWVGHELNEVLPQRRPDWGGRKIKVIGFTPRNIPEGKKRSAEELGATIDNSYEDYGKAQEAIEAAARVAGEIVYWPHGDSRVIKGVMTAALEMKRRIDQGGKNGELRNKRFAVVTAAGAVGRAGGLTAGLTQLFPDVKIVAANTTRIRPLFEAAKVGHPVGITLPFLRVAEDGIAVKKVDEEGLRVFLKRAHAVALMDTDKDDLPSFTHWLINQLPDVGGVRQARKTEAVTGLSLAIPFLYPELFADVDFVIIDETGINIDQDILTHVLAADPVPEIVIQNFPISQTTGGLEESDLRVEYSDGLAIDQETPATQRLYVTVRLNRPPDYFRSDAGREFLSKLVVGHYIPPELQGLLEGVGGIPVGKAIFRLPQGQGRREILLGKAVDVRMDGAEFRLMSELQTKPIIGKLAHIEFSLDGGKTWTKTLSWEQLQGTQQQTEEAAQTQEEKRLSDIEKVLEFLTDPRGSFGLNPEAAGIMKEFLLDAEVKQIVEKSLRGAFPPQEIVRRLQERVSSFFSADGWSFSRSEAATLFAAAWAAVEHTLTRQEMEAVFDILKGTASPLQEGRRLLAARGRKLQRLGFAPGSPAAQRLQGIVLQVRSIQQAAGAGLEELGRSKGEGVEDLMYPAHLTDYAEEDSLNRHYDVLDKSYGGALTRTIKELLGQNSQRPLPVLFIGVGRGNEAIDAQRDFGDQVRVYAVNRKKGEFYDLKSFTAANKLDSLNEETRQREAKVFRAVQRNLKITDIEEREPSFEPDVEGGRFPLVAFAHSVDLHLNDPVQVFNRLLGNLVAQDGYLFVSTERIKLRNGDTNQFFQGFSERNPETVDRIGEYGVRLRNRGGLQIPLVFAESVPEGSFYTYKEEPVGNPPASPASGLEEMVFPEPVPVPVGEKRLSEIPRDEFTGGIPHPAGEGWVLTSFEQLGARQTISVKDLLIDPPAALLPREIQEKFGGLLHGKRLDEPDVNPQLREELMQLLKSAEGPLSFRSLHVRYRQPPENGAPQKEEMVELVPVRVELLSGAALRSADAYKLRVEFEGRLPARRPADYAFAGVMTRANGQKVRLKRTGWIRNLDPAVFELSARPRRVLRGPLSNGQEMQVALFPPGSRAVWRESGVGKDNALDKMMERALKEVDKHHRQVTVRTNVGPKSGLSRWYEPAEFVFTAHLPSLFPMEDAMGPIDWIRISKDQDKEVFTGLKRRQRRATFVLKARKKDANFLVKEAKELVKLLEKKYPDYNAWVIAGEDDWIHLFIVPRHPDNNGDGGVVVAREPYWAVDLSGQGHEELMTLEELRAFGLSASIFSGEKRSPTIELGEPILRIPIDAVAQQGLLTTDDESVFEDPHLRARVELASRLQGIPLDDAFVQQLRKTLLEGNPQEVSRAEVHRFMAEVSSIQTVVQLFSFIERWQQWESRHLEAFNQLDAGIQNEFTREFWRVIEGLGRSSHLIQIQELQPSIREGAFAPPPRDRETDSDYYVDLDGGTQDVMLNLMEEPGGTKRLIVGRIEGGPANQVVRALRSLMIRASLLTESEPQRLSFFLLRPGRGELRVVPKGVTPLSSGDVNRVWDRLPELSVDTKGRHKHSVWHGQRLTGPQEELALVIADRARKAQEKGYSANLFVNADWTAQTLERNLAANPQRVFVPYQAFARYVGEENPESLRDKLGRVAERADLLRMKYDVEEWVVFLETGGMVLVTDDGWWHSLPSSLDELTYTTGAAGAAYGVYGSAVSGGRSFEEGLDLGTRASAFFMSRDPRQWGIPTTREQLWQVHSPEVRPLPIPVKVARERHRYRLWRTVSKEAQFDLVRMDRVRKQMASFPGAVQDFRDYEPWLSQLGILQDDLAHVLFGAREQWVREAEEVWMPLGIGELRREIVQKLSSIPMPEGPTPSYRFVREILRRAVSDADPAVREMARTFWQAQEQSALTSLSEAISRNGTGGIQIEYDPILVDQDFARHLPAQKMEAIQGWLGQQVAGSVQLVPWQGNAPQDSTLRRVTLVLLPPPKAPDLFPPVPAPQEPLDELERPPPRPLYPQVHFPTSPEESSKPAEPPSPDQGEIIPPMWTGTEDFSEALKSRPVLGLHWGGASHPQDDLLLSRASLIALAVAHLSGLSGQGLDQEAVRKIVERDPRFVALQRYFWVMWGRTLRVEDVTRLLSEGQGADELQRKEVAVRKLVLDLSAVPFTALLTEQPELQLPEPDAAVPDWEKSLPRYVPPVEEWPEPEFPAAQKAGLEEVRFPFGSILLTPNAAGVARVLSRSNPFVVQLLWDDQVPGFLEAGLSVPYVTLGRRPPTFSEQWDVLSRVVPKVASERGIRTIGRSRFDPDYPGFNVIVFRRETLGQLMMALAGLEEAELTTAFEEVSEDTESLRGMM